MCSKAFFLFVFFSQLDIGSKAYKINKLQLIVYFNLVRFTKGTSKEIQNNILKLLLYVFLKNKSLTMCFSKAYHLVCVCVCMLSLISVSYFGFISFLISALFPAPKLIAD